jgi:hypothetical protein
VSQLAGRQAAAQLEVLERRQLDLRGALAPRPRRALVCAGELDPLERVANSFEGRVNSFAGFGPVVDSVCHADKCYTDPELLA